MEAVQRRSGRISLRGPRRSVRRKSSSGLAPRATYTMSRSRGSEFRLQSRIDDALSNHFHNRMIHERLIMRFSECTSLCGILACCLAALILSQPSMSDEPRISSGNPGHGEAANTEGRLKVRLSWGHRSGPKSAFLIRLLSTDCAIDNLNANELETGDSIQGLVVQTLSGGGDVDGVELALRFPARRVTEIANPHVIWRELVASSDPDTAQRLRLDPGYRPDSRKLTLQMDHEGTKGFSITVDQLLIRNVLWVPALDVFVAVGESPPSFDAHQKELATWSGQRILDRVQTEPEASYEQFTARWEDMGNPGYHNPAVQPPGHIVGVTWDSAIHKFGIDRGAGVRSDLGNPDQYRFSFDFGEPSPALATSWKEQRLTDGLPVITTRIEKQGVRYDVEQFAYPLDGPPPERRGEISMVLLQKVRVSDLEGKSRTVPIRLNHQRELP